MNITAKRLELKVSIDKPKVLRYELHYLFKLSYLDMRYSRSMWQHCYDINLSDKLFYTQKNEGFTANTLTQFFHYLYRAVGIEGASSHSGRRTFITNLASKGVGVRVLMELSGHKNISTTQAYIDVNDDMMRKAVELS